MCTLGGDRGVRSRAGANLQVAADDNFTHQSYQQGFWFVLPAFCCLSPPAPSHLEEVHADFMSSLTPGVGDVMLKAEQGAFNY